MKNEKIFSLEIVKSSDVKPEDKPNRLIVETPEGALEMRGNDKFVTETLKDLINARGYFFGELRENFAGLLPAEFEQIVNAEYRRVGLPENFALPNEEEINAEWQKIKDANPQIFGNQPNWNFLPNAPLNERINFALSQVEQKVLDIQTNDRAELNAIAEILVKDFAIDTNDENQQTKPLSEIVVNLLSELNLRRRRESIEAGKVEIVGRAVVPNMPEGKALPYGDLVHLSILPPKAVFAVSSTNTKSGIGLFEVLTNENNEVSARYIGNDGDNEFAEYPVQNFAPADTFEVVQIAVDYEFESVEVEGLHIPRDVFNWLDALTADELQQTKAAIDKRFLEENFNISPEDAAEAVAPETEPAENGLVIEADKIAKYIEENFGEWLKKEFPTAGKLSDYISSVVDDTPENRAALKTIYEGFGTFFEKINGFFAPQLIEATLISAAAGIPLLPAPPNAQE